MRAPALHLMFAATLTLMAPTLAPTLAMAQTETETPVAEAAPVLPAITVSTVAIRPMRDVVLASGLIGAVEEVQVQPLIEGQPIRELLAEVGDKVVEGQALARLSLSTLELQKSQFLASLESAKAQIAQADAQILEADSAAEEADRINQRTAALKAEGASSQAAADTARANAVSARARVTVANQSLAAARAQLSLVEAQIANVDLNLRRTEVVAPVAGEIVQRNAQLGGIAVSAGNPMFVIVRDGSLELRAEVAEADLTKLGVGQTVEIVSVGSSTPLSGTVRLVEPRIDPVTRMGTARIEIGQSDLVRSGMFAEARILVVERETAAVPVTALSTGIDGASVMKVTGGSVARVPVVPGIREAGFVEIVEGLVPGETVVTKAGAFVRDGDVINPIPDVPGTN